ncbi:LPS assembly lipoprotein LptE [Nevskia sp.]|uniref:LPS-assembly lipoprotein LptE n=1 Tax=Nevskia sp. TaxID=1929292 RepID=UPI0025D5EBAC|nr:LPS assembly lipoprotein LptE [Nevskia sp.]
MNRIHRLLIGFAATGLLAACGFHPVGSRPMPPSLQSVFVELVDPYRVTTPPVEEALKARIARGGGVVKSKADEAETVLRLSDLREAQEVLSIDNDGRAIEYRLLTRVTFEMRKVVDGKAEILIAPEMQTVSRDYSFSAQQILAKEAEEARLRRYIQDELAERVLLRVEARLSAIDPGLAHPAEAGKPAPHAAQQPVLKPDIVPADAADAAVPG